MDKKIYSSVKKLIAEIIEKESTVLSKGKKIVLDEDSSFMESLEVDSLLALEIVSRIEKKFSIKIKEEDFIDFDSLKNIVLLVERKIAKISSLPKKKTRKLGKNKS